MTNDDYVLAQHQQTVALNNIFLLGNEDQVSSAETIFNITNTVGNESGNAHDGLLLKQTSRIRGPWGNTRNTKAGRFCGDKEAFKISTYIFFCKESKFVLECSPSYLRSHLVRRISWVFRTVYRTIDTGSCTSSRQRGSESQMIIFTTKYAPAVGSVL